MIEIRDVSNFKIEDELFRAPLNGSPGSHRSRLSHLHPEGSLHGGRGKKGGVFCTFGSRNSQGLIFLELLLNYRPPAPKAVLRKWIVHTQPGDLLHLSGGKHTITPFPTSISSPTAEQILIHFNRYADFVRGRGKRCSRSSKMASEGIRPGPVFRSHSAADDRHELFNKRNG